MKPLTLTIRTPFGLEEILAEELRNLGAMNIETMGRAVSCEGDKRLLYKANLALRTANRVLVPIARFEVANEQRLYDEIRKIAWEDLHPRGGTIAVHCVDVQRQFRNSHFLALKAKDAIVDRLREVRGERPSVELDQPDLPIDLQIYRGYCTLSLDSSGSSLHKRGYRNEARLAPLNEVLAAGMILLTGWRGERRFIDPMCGAGTLLIEAAMIAANRAPGLNRERFALQSWPDFDGELWRSVVSELLAAERPIDCELIGYDSSTTAMRLAESNLAAIGLDELVQLEQLPLDQQRPPEGGGVVVINPPYGERLQKRDIDSFYKMIGDEFKRSYKGYEAWLISSNMEALKSIGLKASTKIRLFNGSLECSYRQYELY